MRIHLRPLLEFGDDDMSLMCDHLQMIKGISTPWTDLFVFEQIMRAIMSDGQHSQTPTELSVDVLPHLEPASCRARDHDDYLPLESLSRLFDKKDGKSLLPKV